LISIKTATEADISLINQLGEQAFYPTYLPFISKEQVDYMFHKMYDEASLQQQMKVRGDIFLIIYEDGKPLGFAAYQMDFDKEKTTKLHKLYVLPDTQTKGLGKALMQAVEQNALAAGQKKVLLNVNRYNKAQGFYSRLGYGILREDDIDIGNGFYMNDYEMIKIIG
jgi:GNAT superfamily N-acetyltransferase